MEITLPLVPHPTTPCALVDALTVDVVLVGQTLHLKYSIGTPTDGLAVPDYEEPVRADGLWQKSCCEAFLKAEGRPDYYEINLSPSTQWAVYRFSGYRDGMRPVDIGAAPVIEREAGPDGLLLMARVDLSLLPADMAAADWRLGISAVICGKGGERSFWALNHPPEKPDFHHRDCFAFQINAADRA